MPLRRPATKLRSTSLPPRLQTERLTPNPFYERAAFGPPFFVRSRQGPGTGTCPDLRISGSAAALPRRGIVGPVDSGKVHGRSGRRSEHPARTGGGAQEAPIPAAVHGT